MNIENIRLVADAIEARSLPDYGFNMAIIEGKIEGKTESDMDRTGRHCRTVGCIAGWTHHVLDLAGEPNFNSLCEGFDITFDEATYIALGDWLPPGVCLFTTTDQHAIDYLRRVADEGTVRVKL